MKATEDNVSMKEIGLIVEVNFRFYASETLRMCSLSRGFYLLNSKTWPFLHINSSLWLRHSVSCTWREYWFLEVGGVFRTVHTVVRTEELYAIRLHKTLLKMTVVCYYCRNYFIFISILRAPSRDPGFSLFRGRDSGFLREGGARLVKWNWMGHGFGDCLSAMQDPRYLVYNREPVVEVNRFFFIVPEKNYLWFDWTKVIHDPVRRW